MRFTLDGVHSMDKHNIFPRNARNWPVEVFVVPCKQTTTAIRPSAKETDENIRGDSVAFCVLQQSLSAFFGFVVTTRHNSFASFSPMGFSQHCKRAPNEWANRMGAVGEEKRQNLWCASLCYTSTILATRISTCLQRFRNCEKRSR